MDVQSILKKHAELNFVKRIRDPNIYPNIANKDGSISTHKMTYGKADGKYFVYPTIIQNETGALIELDRKAAWKHAKQTKEHIIFDSEKEAKEFAEGRYKDKPYSTSVF